MEVVIKIPNLSDVLSKGVLVKLAPKGETWVKSQLGTYADKSGVYIHHFNNEILYVGKTTDGNWGTFAERLRREFQETSSQNSGLHQSLTSIKKDINVSMFSLNEIETMFVGANYRADNRRKALILEQLLIGSLKPKFNID
jgi:excinuclease UvrABC nuclease subunit